MRPVVPVLSARGMKLDACILLRHDARQACQPQAGNMVQPETGMQLISANWVAATASFAARLHLRLGQLKCSASPEGLDVVLVLLED